MQSTPADYLVPASIAIICAVALGVAAQLGPDHIPRLTAGNLTGATGKAPVGTLPKLKWHPQPDTRQPLTHIGFGSCQRQKRPIPIWSSVIAARPQTFLMLGDNVYGDFNEPTASKLVQAYDQLRLHADFSKARAAVPMLATWDDHDYGRNDGGAEFEHKAVATKLFRAFWQGSGTLQGVRGPGIAYARTFGPQGRRVQIIMLDTRSFRSNLTLRPKGAPGKGKYQPSVSPDQTMLGTEQWQWLEARLREPVDLRLIASGIQVLAEGRRFERWGNLPRERDKLLGLLDTTGAHPTIFLSGDRHRAAFYRMKREGKADIVEATSSALNSSFRDPNETGPHQLSPMLGQNNFGMINIDWDARVATMSLRREDGIAARALAIKLDGKS